jgi:uncharacterized lipoprotein
MSKPLSNLFQSAVLAVLAACVVLAGCSREKELVCIPATTYLEAESIDALRIPGELSVPDETESLRIPDAQPVAVNGESVPQTCLESSPAFSRTD